MMPRDNPGTSTPAKDLLTKIRFEKQVVDRSGKTHAFHSGVDEQEGRFLQELIDRHSPSRSVEIGCAFGVSSLNICDALSRNSDRHHHTIIDPFQKTNWHEVGLYHLEQCGFDFVQHIEDRSEFALPQLLQEKGDEYFDFALIDGMHTLDHTLLDMFYVNRLLKVGGIVVVDDVNMPAINSVMRYFLNYPCYEFEGKADHNPIRKGKILTAGQSVLSLISNLIPKRHHFFSAPVIKSNKRLGIDSSMVALRKVASDDRNWNWFKYF